MEKLTGESSSGLVPVEAFHELEEKGARKSADHNLLIRGENSFVMPSLLEKFRGRIDLIYIDPPFDIGADISTHISFGENSSNSSPKSDLFKAVAYGDSWEKADETYLQMIHKRLLMCREFLSDRGSLYLHCDYRTTAYLRLLLEEVFGRKNYINECIWHYKTGGMPEKLGYGRKHDTIHFVAKNAGKAIWHPQKEKSYVGHKYGFSNIDLQHDERGHYTMVQLRDVWTIPALRGNQPERVDYPTQKPEALLERIIRASSDEGSIVADFFCGSGTTGAVAEKLGRRWIMCDQGSLAIHTCRKRLLDLHSELKHKGSEPPRPFSVLELRDDERKAWAETKGGDAGASYGKLVLELLNATPEESEDGLFHGTFAGSPCHIFGIDQIVSASDIQLLQETAAQKGAEEIWCIGWAFDSDIAMEERPGKAGLSVRLVQIPREVHQQGRKSAPQFFELPRFSFDIEHKLDNSYDVRLLQYTPARTLGNEEGHPGRRNEDYIDLWAVDFDFKRGEHFHYDWCDFRNRRKRCIETSSSAHWNYPAAGTYTVAVKVVDVCGVETVAVKKINVGLAQKKTPSPCCSHV